MNIIIALALVADLLTPFLIWKGILPAYTRWISHAALALMLVGAIARMLVFDRVPGIVWVIVGISAIGITVALFQDQSIAATAWGWWLIFQYPMVGLFAYLQPTWPSRFPQQLRGFCILVLAVQLILQIGQFWSGVPPGDDLSGLFGEYGTADMAIFTLLVLCLALGAWLTRGSWSALVWVLVLGGASSTLGEVKLFPFAAVVIGILAVTISFLRNRQMWKLISYAAISGAVVLGFFGIYDAIVPAAERKPLERYLEPQNLVEYFGGTQRILIGGRYYYDVGRNYALAYGWNTIRSDTATLLFGMGLGARRESQTLGITGVGLINDELGLHSGSSLLIFVQELGLLGLVILGGFIVYIATSLIRIIKISPHLGTVELAYGLLIFSLLWPLWIWYFRTWTSHVPMLIYWVALGYVLGDLQRLNAGTRQSSPNSVTSETYDEFKE